MGNILSVSIDNDKVRICEASKSSGNVTVKNAFEAKLPSDVVEDGMIMDVEKTAEALQAVLQSNNIKRGKIAFVISSRKIAQKEVVLPFIKNAAKIEEIVKANIDEYFPMNNLEDYIYRHTILDTFENAEGKHYSVLVTAVQKQMIEGYYQVAAQMKLPVLTVDFYSNSIYQLLKKQLNQGTVLAIQMDRNVTYVSIMRDKAQLFKRSIPYGKDTIIRNLADLKGISEEEAEKILTDPEQLDKNLTPEEYGEVIRDFSSSVTRVAEFHTSRNPGTMIEVVRLMGSGINLIGFTDVLGRELGIEVTVLKELNGLKISKKNPAGLNYEKLVDYLPNVGALMKSLELKAGEEKKGTDTYKILYVLLALAVLSNLGVAGFFMWQYHNLKAVKEQLEADIAKVESSEAVYNAYKEALADYDQIQNYYEGTKNSNEMLYQMIVDLEQVMPESVGITNLASENGSIDVTGLAGGKDALAKFVIELKKLPYVSNVRVENITDSYDEFGNSTSVFNMSFNLNLLPEEAEQEGDSIQEAEQASEGGNE